MTTDNSLVGFFDDAAWSLEKVGRGWVYSVPIGESGGTRMEFRDIASGYGGIECEVTIYHIFPGVQKEPYEARITLVSMSGRETLARGLGKFFGKEMPWDRLVASACGALRRAVTEEDESVDIDTVTPFVQEDDPFLPPFVVKGGANVIFGKGGTSKTFLALKICAALLGHGDFLGVKPTKPYAGRVLYIDYEANAGELRRRLINLGISSCAGRFHYLNPRGLPLHERVKAIQGIVEKNGIELIIVDSVAPACGGRPEEAEMAVRLFNALAMIGVTSLLIAHETKQETGSYPFGSVFFWNLPRNIWNIKAINEPGSQLLQAGLFHRKSNNSALSKPFGVRVWNEKDKTEISRGELAAEWASENSTRYRILQCLVPGPMTLEQLTTELADIQKAVLKVRLSEMRKRGEVDNLGGAWITTKPPQKSMQS